VFIYGFILGFQIRYLTNTRIIFPPETDSTNEIVTIVGKKENVNKAKAKFEVMITDIGNAIKEHVEINEKYHRSSGTVGATHRGLRDLGPSIQKKTDMNKNRSLR
jgi:hypothetical protein